MVFLSQLISNFSSKNKNFQFVQSINQQIQTKAFYYVRAIKKNYYQIAALFVNRKFASLFPGAIEIAQHLVR